MERLSKLDNVLIVLYLVAAITANLVVTSFGHWALVVTAFILIPFDLVTRDILHDRWENNKLKSRMFFLLLSGSVISYLINRQSLYVAIANATAFFLAGICDFVVYHALIHKKRIIKINVSNILSSLVDSVVFPLIAFSMFDPIFSLSQSGSKFLGGAFWSIIYIFVIKKNGKIKNEM